jgi:hypothetical protein
LLSISYLTLNRPINSKNIGKISLKSLVFIGRVGMFAEKGNLGSQPMALLFAYHLIKDFSSSPHHFRADTGK